jgi:hypothetical protein
MIRIESSDTCEIRKLNEFGPEFRKIDFVHQEIKWDSIVITNESGPFLKKILKKDDAEFRYFLLNVNQEVNLLVNDKVRLHNSADKMSHNYKINVFRGGHLIKSSSGNYFPQTLFSMYHLLMRE